jgi:hypothetical protein
LCDCAYLDFNFVSSLNINSGGSKQKGILSKTVGPTAFPRPSAQKPGTTAAQYHGSSSDPRKGDSLPRGSNGKPVVNAHAGLLVGLVSSPHGVDQRGLLCGNGLLVARTQVAGVVSVWNLASGGVSALLTAQALLTSPALQECRLPWVSLPYVTGGGSRGPATNTACLGHPLHCESGGETEPSGLVFPPDERWGIVPKAGWFRCWESLAMVPPVTFEGSGVKSNLGLADSAKWSRPLMLSLPIGHKSTVSGTGAMWELDPTRLLLAELVEFSLASNLLGWSCVGVAACARRSPGTLGTGLAPREVVGALRPEVRISVWSAKRNTPTLVLIPLLAGMSEVGPTCTSFPGGDPTPSSGGRSSGRGAILDCSNPVVCCGLLPTASAEGATTHHSGSREAAPPPNRFGGGPASGQGGGSVRPLGRFWDEITTSPRPLRRREAPIGLPSPRPLRRREACGPLQDAGQVLTFNTLFQTGLLGSFSGGRMDHPPPTGKQTGMSRHIV